VTLAMMTKTKEKAFRRLVRMASGINDQMNGDNGPNGFPPWMPIVAIGAIAAMSVAFVLVRRKKKV
jgi:LPXTG-motif cell wall-anchored protein